MGSSLSGSFEMEKAQLRRAGQIGLGLLEKRTIFEALVNAQAAREFALQPLQMPGMEGGRKPQVARRVGHFNTVVIPAARVHGDAQAGFAERLERCVQTGVYLGWS